MALSNMFLPDGEYPLGLDYNPSLGELLDLAGRTVVSQTPFQQVVTLSNGLTVIFNGIGLQYNQNGIGAGGVLTSIRVLNGEAELVNQLLTAVSFEQFGLRSITLDAWELNKFLMQGNDLVNGSVGDDDIRGHDGNDVLNGGAGNDFIVGGHGDDTYNGGLGTDTLSYDDAVSDPTVTHGVVINAAGGFALDYDNALVGNLETFTGIEKFVGTQFRDVMQGGNGNETFTGLDGNDTINGGGGIDTVSYERDALRGSTHGVNVNLTTGVGLDGFTGVDTLVNIENVDATQFDDTVTGNNGANVIRTFDGNDTIVALGGNDTIDAGAGNDAIDTGTGNDSVSAGAGNDRIETGGGIDNVRGGAGDDTYVVHNVFTVVDEAAEGGAGIDTVVADVSYDLQAQQNADRVRGNVENLTLVGLAAVFGAGNDLDNTINGSIANNVLLGRSGNDTVNGDAGHDFIDGGTGNDVLDGGLGDDVLVGDSGHDRMTGGAGDDDLAGGDGNDTLEGGAGQDRLAGGFGNDSYNIGASEDGDDTILDTGGVDTLISSISRSLEFYSSDDAQNIENLTLEGLALNGTGSSGNNVITGNALNNVLLGLAGNDTLRGEAGDDFLDGGRGDDSMFGGIGNDRYIVDGDDSIIDTGGIDTVQSSVQSLFLTDYSGADNLVFTGIRNLNGSGTNGANVMTGNNGNNVLAGLGGNDSLFGGFGNDSLLGGAGNDALNGGEGNDRINGGAGRDSLRGGLGNDAFVFDQSLTIANRDGVVDFNRLQDQFLLESDVFRAVGSSVSSFEFRVGVRALDANDHLIYNQANGNLMYDSNGSGAGGLSVVANLSNHASMTAADFTII